MRRHDDQVRFLRFRDLDDCAVGDTHDDLATDLDRGVWGLRQHLCELKTRLALQIVNERGPHRRGHKAFDGIGWGSTTWSSNSLAPNV